MKDVSLRDSATLTMKRATPANAEQLVAMMEEFYAEGGYPLNHRRAAEAFATLLADDRLGYVFFIHAGTDAGIEDVGYVVVTLCYSMEYGGLNAFVDDLFVRKPFRGTGLGTAALTEVRAFCAKRGVRAIHVEPGRENAAAQAVYRRIGFVETNRLHLTLKLADPTHTI